MPEKIISGGQTGADRAALDFAIARNIPHGGWCPRGRLAEDGRISERYELAETPATDYAQRTEWNVRDSDGTVIFTIGRALAGGSKQTSKFAKQLGKPWLHLSQDADGNATVDKLRQFLSENRIKVLNVAGSRKSQERQVGDFTTVTLTRLWDGSEAAYTSCQK
ncbi:MAG: putative molybdenum carrier protein [Verrucomicrobia bacterium]|nr:putative molybdenum carrier protein [Verrucomicrobiota bacterium]